MLLLTIALLAPLPDLPTPAARGPGFHAGVSLGLFASTRDREYQEILYGGMLEEIAALGATDLQLVVRWVQRDVRADALRPQPGITPPDALVRWALVEAERLHLRVFLLPIVHLQRRGSKAWRGTLRPADPEAWWRSYRAFVLHYARLAPDAHMLSVGSELLAMEREEARWRALIAEVRAVFPGRLTYSANWDHFEPVRFWDALDLIGVSAYWPLAKAPGAEEAEMALRWRGFRRRLEGFARARDRRYLLTEVGFPSHAWGPVRPWDHGHRGAPDMEAQRRAWRATLRAWHDAPRLDGLYTWNWFGVGGPGDSGYTPRGKPAAEVLRAWFTAASASRSPGPPSTRRSPPASPPSGGR